MDKRKGTSLILYMFVVSFLAILTGLFVTVLSGNNPLEKWQEMHYRDNLVSKKMELESRHFAKGIASPDYKKENVNILLENALGVTNSAKEENHHREMQRFISKANKAFSREFGIFRGNIVYSGKSLQRAQLADSVGISLAPQKLAKHFVNGVYGGNEEKFLDVIETEDGGFIAVGESSSRKVKVGGRTDADGKWSKIFAVKYSASGEEMWRKGYGKSPWHQFGLDIVKLADGNYVICGYGWLENTDMQIGQYDLVAVKIDKFGREIWQKSFGTKEGSESPSNMFALATTDGGLLLGSDSYISATKEMQGYIAKVDTDGNLVKERIYPECVNVSSAVEEGNCYNVLLDEKAACIYSLDKNTLDVTEKLPLGENLVAEELIKLSQNRYAVATSALNGKSRISFVDIASKNVSRVESEIDKVNASSVHLAKDLKGKLIVATSGIRITRINPETKVVEASYMYGDNKTDVVNGILTTRDGGAILVGETTREKDFFGEYFRVKEGIAAYILKLDENMQMNYTK